MKKLLLLTIAYCQLSIANCQPPPGWSSAEMYQALRKLNVLGSVLYIAAHPDDENTRLISYLSKDRLYRTGYLSMTRGDGGQNLIGDEQGIELGLIRTQELLAARRVDGGEQFFTRAYDFGYSKTAAETFTKWDKEKILGDVVWVIRKFQPDIIINRFPETGEGGHGHHTASGILANEAFAAAADPARFPEQLEYVTVWQAKRVLWNTFNFGGNNTTREDQLKIDVGGYNPLLGKSYGEISAQSRSQHKSQGFGVPASRGEALEYFKATKGDQPVNDLMDGIDLTWKRLPGGEAIAAAIDSISKNFDFLHPGKSVKGLVELYAAVKSMPTGYWQKKKLEEVKQLIQQCSGLFIDVTTSEQFAVKTDSIRITLSVNNRLGVSAILKNVVFVGSFDSVFNHTLTKNKNLTFGKTVSVDDDRTTSQPYWLVEKMSEGYFNVQSQEKRGQPDIDPSYQAMVVLNVEGVDIPYINTIKYKFTDPVKGEIYQPLIVLPKILASSDADLKLSLNNNNSFEGTLNLILKTRKQGIGIKYITTQEKDIKEQYTPSAFPLTERNRPFEVAYKIQANKDLEHQFFFNDGSMPDHVLPAYEKDKDPLASYKYPAESITEIKYDHIPFITYFKKVSVKNIKLDLNTYGKKIGYIPGAGDKVPEALEQMGFEVNMLTDKEMSKNSLNKFDCIITGVRAYNTNEWLNKHYDKLMKYVNDGGNLIVQYNTSSNLGPVRARIGPYHFNITRTRITDENAAVTLLKPEHPAFNFPNKITDEDFKGWIQERSIYHGSDTTGKFEKLISMADPGEKADDGSLLVTKYGKGWFTYTGLVFFRELPAGVPGAYRLMANLIALNKKKGF